MDHFVRIASLLSDLLRKGQVWRWSTVECSAFHSLKTIPMSPLVLPIPVLDELFVVRMDASDTHIGAVVEQSDQPVAYFSCKLSSTECNYLVTDHKLLAIFLHVSSSIAACMGQSRQWSIQITRCWCIR